jgi:hypothetical protein
LAIFQLVPPGGFPTGRSHLFPSPRSDPISADWKNVRESCSYASRRGISIGDELARGVKLTRSIKRQRERRSIKSSYLIGSFSHKLAQWHQLASTANLFAYRL